MASELPKWNDDKPAPLASDATKDRISPRHSHDIEDQKQQPYSTESASHKSDPTAPHDLEAKALYDREHDLDEDEKKSDGPIAQLKMLLHSRGAVIVRDFGLIALLLGWWIPSIINERVRHRWIVATIFSWFFILLILMHKSRYIPQRPIVRVISAVWTTAAEKPWSRIPYKGKLAVGWLSLAVLVFGSTYGLPIEQGSSLGQRTISLVGYCLIYAIIFAFSSNYGAVQARTTILGMGLQFIIALFVFRTGAGLSLFSWIATAAADLLAQGVNGGAAFFWRDFVENGYFFTNVLSSIAFFVALCIVLFYIGVLPWLIKKAAWFFYKVFGISGAEAIVAVASPFIGQGENVVLTRPFVKSFTRSEFHQVLVSGFATIAGSVLAAYISIGVNGTVLVTSSVMSIPAAIAASKLRYPETQHSYTAGKIQVSAQEDEVDRANDVFHSLSKGAWFGVRVAALIFANVLAIVSLLYTVNGLLTYIGRSWYIPDDNPLKLELIFGYLLWPLTFLLGVPGHETLAVSKLIAVKVIANEFVAYDTLQNTVMPNPETRLSPRAYLIAQFALCGFGNIGSLGINVGILSAIAPTRSATIVKLCPSALLTGILVTLSSAAVAGIVGIPAEYVPVAPAAAA
ncbi:hypothetical protein IE81DRAFT_320199 [Ceraceosorus guamensis]|uniref:H+/nucleoside cotransporter n=1 Tax=Ceraceosorus guamensis TaxID=1522189 RepID=A0A316W8J8_9BASI|nr:hypothetical protein IE81DRAFT_320199 [Ceraceosorus guamensis]PWN45438.1 hypothetical protein IE81DRAFT_320199 [Ceraceosorus guamensis]